MDILKELLVEKDIVECWLVASPKTDIFWSCEPYGQRQISKITTTWLHTRTSVDGKTKKEMARQHSWELWGYEYQYYLCFLV